MNTYRKNWNRTLATVCLAAAGLSGAYAQDAKADAKLSQALGFASRLHSETEMVLGLRNVAGLADSIGKSNTWKRITGLMMEAGGVDLSDAEMPYQQVMSFIGKDAFIAFGKGTDAEMGRLMDLYNAYYKVYYKFMGTALLASMDLGDGAGGEPSPEELIKGILSDEALLKSLHELQLPPMILGCRPPNGQAAKVVKQMTDLEADLPPIVVASEFEVAGAGKFRSWALAAKDAFADEYRAKMREEIGGDLAAKLEKVIDSKKVELSFGAVGDYIILGVGTGHAHLKLAANGGESLVSNPDFEFIKGYTDKRLLAYSYSAKSVLSALNRPDQFKTMTDAGASILTQMSKGGINVAKAIPLVNKLGDLIVKASAREVDSSAGVIYIENGLKGASVGGFSMPGMDEKAVLKLAGAAPKDAFLTINAASDPAAADQSTEILETLVAAAYHIGSGVARAEGNEDFAEMFGMYDQMFRPKLLNIWTILKNKVGKGLGDEGGLVIDLNGSMPKIPGVPGVLIKQGKLPRIAMFNTVKDRKLLTQAWEELVPAINDLAKAIPGQEPGREFQIPDPLSSDGKNVKTHFMGLPFVSNDFLPSLSISDELFFLSTSKNFSEDLAAKIAAGGGEKKTGILFRMRLDALHDYAEGWLDLVVKNSKEVFGGNEFAEEDFKENAGNIRMVLSFLDGLKGFEVHRYKDARWRTDWHFEVTDIK